MRVLLPTDFSENAWHAIQYAVYLFENTPCSFYILHAHQTGPSGLVSTINKERETRLHDITQEEAGKRLHRLVGQLKKINKVKSHQFEAILESDSLLNAIGRNIIDCDIDFIFMGTQGASGLKEIFMGSNTVNVLKNIHFCPLLAVPRSYQFKRPSEIAFATDYRHLYQKVELEPLIALTSLWSANVRVIHIAEEKELEKEQHHLQKLLKRLLNEIPISFETLEYHPTLAHRINDWTDNNHIDILAMINSQHGFFRRLLREPVIKKVAFKTHLPFLVLPEITDS